MKRDINEKHIYAVSEFEVWFLEGTPIYGPLKTFSTYISHMYDKEPEGQMEFEIKGLISRFKHTNIKTYKGDSCLVLSAKCREEHKSNNEYNWVYIKVLIFRK